MNIIVALADPCYNTDIKQCFVLGSARKQVKTVKSVDQLRRPLPLQSIPLSTHYSLPLEILIYLLVFEPSPNSPAYPHKLKKYQSFVSYALSRYQT